MARPLLSRMPSLSTVGFILGLLTMMVLAAISVITLRSYGQAAAKIAHVQRVSQAVVVLLSEMNEAEAGARGYVITGRAEDLQGHQSADQRVAAVLSDLQGLTAFGRTQHCQRVQSLAALVAEEDAALHQAVQARRERGREAAMQMMLADQQPQVMDRLQRTGEDLITDEARVLGEQTRNSERQTRRLATITLAGAVLALLLVGLALWRAWRSQVSLSRQSERLRESEEKFRMVAENARAVFGIVQGRKFVYANPYLADATGYSMDELLSMDLAQLLHSDHRQMVADRARRRQLGEDVPAHYEFIMLTKGGQQRWIEFSGARIEYKGRAAIIGTGFDITDRKRAEEALRASEERYRTLFELSPDGVALVDVNGRIAAFNQHICRQLGYTPEEFARLSVADLEAQEKPDEVRDHLQRMLRDGIDRFETRHRTRQGQVRDVAISARKVGLDGKICFLCVWHDITQQKQLEQQLREAKQSAEQANAAKDQFLAVLSHELRTPLTPVLAAVSLLETDQRLGRGVRQDMRIIRRNVELEARLIDDLLDLTRIVRGKLELHQEPVDVHLLLERAMGICCQGDVFGKQLRVSRSLSAARHQAWGDPVRLEQVFWNLLNNAVKFTPSCGQIEIRSVNPDPEHIRIEVQDSGIGIEPDMLERIFNAFEQGERSTTRQFGGLGLGLAITRRLVELHGGTIAACSKGRGKGATFSLELPVLAGAAAPAEGQGPEAPVEHAQKLRILLVEDHADTARIMRQILMLDGHEVRTAGDVASALDLAGRESFDLIISDLGLPDGSGLDVMRHLRDTHRAVRGIALSGFGRQEDVQRSREAGFAEHLTKPVDLGHLNAAILRVTEAGPARP